MKEVTLTSTEQRVLNCIINQSEIARSDLTRRMHSMNITDEDDKQTVLDSLQCDHNFIDSRLESFKVGKRGRKAQVFFPTDKGKQFLKELIKNNNKQS